MKIDTNFTPAFDEISARAFAIWEQRGRPTGEELAHWALAEAQLCKEHFSAAEVVSSLAATAPSIPAAEEVPSPSKAPTSFAGKSQIEKTSRKRKT